MNLGLFFFGFLLFLTSLFMILVILVQRGRGGGLTGALGGTGGQSAFGAKAGDTFTRITVVTAIIWIALCMLTIKIFNPVHPPAAAQSDQTMGAGESGNALPEEDKTGVDNEKDGDQSAAGDSSEKTSEVPVVPPAETPTETPADDAANKGTESVPATEEPPPSDDGK